MGAVIECRNSSMREVRTQGLQATKPHGFTPTKKKRKKGEKKEKNPPVGTSI